MNEPNAAPALPDTPAPAAPPSEPNSQPTPSPAPLFAVPDAYKDKPWSSKIKTQDDLWKQLDNTQTLVGKKIIVPDFESGDPKEIEEYVNNLRPKDKAAYKFEAIPEGDRGVISDIIHKVGVPASMANKMMGDLMAHVNGLKDKMFDNNAFMEDMKKSLGENYKEKFKETSEVLKKMLSPEDHKLIDIDAPNIYSSAVYKIATKLQEDYKALSKKLHEQYGATETGAAGEGDQADVGQVDKLAERKRLRAEISALSKKQHDASDLEKLIQDLDATYRK